MLLERPKGDTHSLQSSNILTEGCEPCVLGRHVLSACEVTYGISQDPCRS